MRIKKPLLCSISISVVAHVLFFTCAAGIRIPGVYATIERSKRFFNIKSLEKEIPRKKPLKRREVAYAQALRFESPLYSESITSYRDEGNVEKASLIPKSEAVEKAVSASKREDVSDLMESEKEYKALKAGSPRDTREDLVEVARLPGDGVFAEPKDVLGESELPRDFLEKMPGFTPERAGGFLDRMRQKVVSRFSKSYMPAVRREKGFVDLDSYLVCGLSTYEDPGDGQKYFKLSIMAGNYAEDLPRAPKEIVFLVDCSLSILPARLREFKKGLRYILNHLNPEDRFNIMAFKEEMSWFRPRSVEPNRSNIQDALTFVDRLRLAAGVRTDVYSALYQGIKVDSVIEPSYIVLFSDGHPTRGVTSSKRITSEISKLNRGKRPIFAFSGGWRVNRYLLDFISYKNRGWTEYAQSTYSIGRHIASMYEKIKDPVLLNLRYRASGLDEEEVFPKTLPDFFRNAEFTLFGRCVDGGEFSLQLLGDSDGETNEFIVVGSFKNAAEGGRDIATNWAFNKIYHLIGLLEYGKENERIVKEIALLCDKFDIKIPYSRWLRE